MFRHDYPYTDFHELNIDWLLKEWEKFLTEYQSTFTEVEELKEAVEGFRVYLENYFDNLDVQEEINNKLDEMERDGSLETILSHYVYITHNPDLVQVLNVAMNTHIYDVPTNPQPAFLQGYTCYNGVSYLAFMDATSTVNSAIIRSYSNSTGQLLNESTIQNAYHANSMCVHDNQLLLCTNEHHIIGINPATLQQETVYTVTKDIKSVSSYNGVLYVTDSNYDLWAMTLPPDESYEFCCNYQQNNPEYSFIQSGCVYGDYFYAISHNPKCIAAININTGSIRNIINIDDYYYMYNTGEIEDLTIVSGDEVYLASCTYGTYDQYRTGRVFNFSLNQNDARSQTYAGGDYNPISTFYVNANTNGNPTGTQTNPFPTLSQAMQALSSPIALSYQTVYVYLLKDCDEILYTRRNNIHISGNNHSIIRAYINASHCTLNDLTIRANAISGNYYALHCVESIIVCNQLTLSGNYSGSYDHAGQITNCIGSIVNLETNNNVVQVYRSDINSDTGTIRKLTYQDIVSAKRFVVDGTTMTVPANRALYRKLSFEYYRGEHCFHCETYANFDSGTFTFVENYTFSDAFTFIIHDISFSITNGVISFSTDSYSLAADGTKATSSSSPTLAVNSIVYTP